MTDSLLSWRSEFPLLSSKNYLISNSLGAMPRSVYTRMQDYAEAWATKGVKAWADEWWDLPVRVGDVIAPLIGADAGTISMHPNVTLVEAIIASCFEGPERGSSRRKIVCEELNFPSIIYFYREWARTHGCELTLIPSDDGMTINLERMLDAIDDQTLIVPISHVLFKSAFIQNAKAIIDRAHAVGATVVLDAYQSVGILPLNVKELEVDFLVGGVLKWLCGGPGGAFLYVRPDLSKRITPRLTGWFAHEEPFVFDPVPMRYRDDAFRFLNGTPAIPALYAATEGPRIIAQIGVDRIREKSIHQTSLLIQKAKERDFIVRSPLQADQRGGTVTLDVPHAREVSQELIARNVLVDYREGAGIRLSPHFYTADEELLRALEEVKDILTTKAYHRHSAYRPTVT